MLLCYLVYKELCTCACIKVVSKVKLSLVVLKFSLIISCGSKRKLEEWDVSEIKAQDSANIHFRVTHVSPIKESKRNKKIKYFDSKVTDGKTSARLVSFDHHMRDAFVESKEKGTSLRLASCGVKPGNNQEMEILAGNHSKLSHSPRKFDVRTVKSRPRLSSSLTCQLWPFARRSLLSARW